MQALARFQNDSSCCVLVMDGSAAVGLDLSFVSRVYLMEPIWDKSLEEQVTLDVASFALCCAFSARWVNILLLQRPVGGYYEIMHYIYTGADRVSGKTR
jgi:hypothetical protein